MKSDNLGFFLTISLLIILTACSKEREPIFINGTWEARFYESVNCTDSTLDISIDFTKDSSYVFGDDTFRYLKYTFDFDSSGTDYSFTREFTVNGSPQTITTSGTYLSRGFNDIIFCKTDCVDSLWDYGLYVRTGNQLDLSWRDTIDTNCGFLFQGVRVQ